MKASSFDAVIVGGGIVGAATAAACARVGMRIALVERDVIGGGATAAGMGHIVVMDDSEAQLVLTRYSQLLWSRIAPSLSARTEYEMPGTLWLAADDEEMVEAERKLKLYHDRDIPAHILSAREISEIEPNLRIDLAGGLLVPEDAVVYPPAAALHFADLAESLGATLIIRREVKAVRSRLVLLGDGQELTAPFIVNATGACAPELVSNIPVKKRKGHLVITDRYPGFVRHQLVELGYLKSAHSVASDSVAFNVQPRKTGQVLIGSSRQYGDETSNVDQQIVGAMLQRATTYLPSLGSLNATRVWTGFRAATPDKLPLIGPSSRDETVWLATGHEGLGITTSLATGEMLAMALSGGQMPIPLDPYLPSRFDSNNQPTSGEEPI